MTRVLARWAGWDGRCGCPLPMALGGVPLTCANPVGRIRYALRGCCGRCWGHGVHGGRIAA